MPTQLSMNGKRLVIKELLAQRGITNVQLAKTIGVTTPTVSYILNGKTLPSLKTLADIANFLNVTMGELFDDYKKDITQDTLRCPKCGTPLELKIKE